MYRSWPASPWDIVHEYLVDERSELDETSAGLQILGRLANCNGVLAVTWVDLPCDHRKNVLDRLPFVGGAGTPSPCALICSRRAWPSGSTSSGASTPQRTFDQQCLEQVLQRMEHSWPQFEEHYAKLAINSLVGLFARNLVCSMKTSNHQVDGEGCSWRQTFTDAVGGTHWDHVFVTELLPNSSYRPVHDYIMGAEYVAVARIRQALAEVPRRYLKMHQDRLSGDAGRPQEVPARRGAAAEDVASGRHARLSLRAGHQWRTP